MRVKKLETKLRLNFPDFPYIDLKRRISIINQISFQYFTRGWRAGDEATRAGNVKERPPMQSISYSLNQDDGPRISEGTGRTEEKWDLQYAWDVPLCDVNHKSYCNDPRGRITIGSPDFIDQICWGLRDDEVEGLEM